MYIDIFILKNINLLLTSRGNMGNMGYLGLMFYDMQQRWNWDPDQKLHWRGAMQRHWHRHSGLPRWAILHSIKKTLQNQSWTYSWGNMGHLEFMGCLFHNMWQHWNLEQVQISYWQHAMHWQQYRDDRLSKWDQYYSSVDLKHKCHQLFSFQVKEHGTVGAHGVPAPQRATAQEPGAGPDLILAICHAWAVIMRRQTAKVRSIHN